ncbi:Hsp33 family molecular chaperone HslO [Aliidiomarina sedimenti]|uniref:Hsp33 family molecular chaperone HslO n=1 Tax=Aliidiomarina sedimenti TaxID=1933879 RepID=A0ABY0BZ86_9GAMM|nr:Hsp33 family molecular chaperone HslO [Aliidiomarina sedimenti]RUO29842.1 Hsp33 family molecular chaperone HslO [Aliidiomarina sedimenti]
MQSADSLIRYTFANAPVRGELVQLQQSYQRLVEGHAYPAGVQQLLGELMAVTSLLTATLKFDGHINLQIQGDGALNFATVNGSHDQLLRGVARLTATPADDSFAALMGAKSYLIITLTPKDGERYQGLVEVRRDDHSLSQVIERYFTQSEQLNTRVWLHTSATQVAGLLLQALPGEDDPERGFDHLATLTTTMTADELHTLEANVVLHRLYHEEDLRVFEPVPVRFFCGCSKEKSMHALYSVPIAELKDILQQDGDIRLTCDYCLTEYVYDEEDVAAVQGYQQSGVQ